MTTNEYLTLFEAKELIKDTTYEWKPLAQCLDIDSTIFIPTDLRGRSSHKKYLEAKQYCFECSVRTECLAYALVNKCEFGVFGGLIPEERKSLHNRLTVREIFRKKDSKWKNDSDAKSATEK